MHEPKTTASDIAAAIEAGRTIGENTIHSINGIPVAITREGVDYLPLENLLDNPKRIRKIMECGTADSFIAYHQAFASDSGMITCDIANGRLVSHLDYHRPDQASHDDHIAKYTIDTSDEWDKWTLNSDKAMTQEKFSEHIEDNLEEIIEPNGASMLEMAQHLTANKKVKIVSGKRLHNGQMQFQYIEETDGQAGPKGSIKIPEEFTLAVEPFRGAGKYRIQAKFRYRISAEGLCMRYHLHRQEKAFEQAVIETAKRIAEQTACPLFIYQ